MSNVHEEISKHSKKQHELVKAFLTLENQRESFIAEAVSLAKNDQPFTVEHINMVTKEINNLARNGIAPTRKLVTSEMVIEFAKRDK
ncbi:DUF2533 family protein [Litchfieldia salsa]|uniref:DUF2533 family protein n=1 Tax=Litchfieldia salsa TaxID=930152 RepID=A0A1H0TI90_9BACI|nr:DUF2533 family protein [Litchfieldia salsa]SDP53565.1 Protein of unknown function [Litchfieldia salsa]